MAKYFVISKSAWCGAEWSPVSGPFASKAEAQAEADKRERRPASPRGGIDIKEVVYTKVVSRTALAKMGWRDDLDLYEHLVSIEVNELRRGSVR